MSSSICKCGRKILWGLTLEGKRVPLDPSAPVYMIIDEAGPVIERDIRAHVSHFAICKFANEFSGRTKPTPPETAETTHDGTN